MSSRTEVSWLFHVFFSQNEKENPLALPWTQLIRIMETGKIIYIWHKLGFILVFCHMKID